MVRSQKSKWPYVSILWLLALLAGGCSNAILFGEKGQFGMVLEADAKNAAAPIVGSIAAKHTLMVIVPGNGELQNTTDAASMFSQFSMSKHPEANNPWGRLKIHTAFITGDACDGMDKEDLADAANAFAGIMAIPEVNTSALELLAPYGELYNNAPDKTPFNDAASDLGYQDFPDAYNSETLTVEEANQIIATLNSQDIKAL